MNVSWCSRKWVFLIRLFSRQIITLLRLKQQHENHCNCLEDVAHNYYIKTCDPENLTLWKQPCEILLLLRLGEILSTQSSILSRFNLQSQDRNMAASNSKRKYWFISVLSYSQPKEKSHHLIKNVCSVWSLQLCLNLKLAELRGREVNAVGERLMVEG